VLTGSNVAGQRGRTVAHAGLTPVVLRLLKDQSEIVWASTWSSTYNSIALPADLPAVVRAVTRGQVNSFVRLYVRAHANLANTGETALD
jgi:hypothetical protein